MNYAEIDIVLQEVPGEISICFSITGCKLKCNGCHSSFLWNEKSGNALTKELFQKTLLKYQKFASCVLFMGGEWCKNELIQLLKEAQEFGYKTCLYSGEEKVDQQIMKYLTWLKTGPWIETCGGLDSKKTNQQFIEVKTNKILNDLF